MSLPFLRTLQGDRFFQLLILVGIGLSFFVPFVMRRAINALYLVR